MTPDREQELALDFRVRVGAVFDDVMAQVRASAKTQDQANSMYARLTYNVMLLAAFMHMNGEHGDSFAAFVELAERAYLCALLPVDGRLAP